MDTLHTADSAAARALPETTPNARRLRLAALDDSIARIRTQIAAADLERQAKAKKIDPGWFHRAKTALRHLQRERAELLATTPAAATRKAALKDAIIEVVRREHDDASWAAVLNEAHRLTAG
ncbi:hypothetical protein, partial [Aestuariivirga sp.]|uniref:hypothetical protein n=1 Tax=Aestuariivirga sp. TaxID=2650926 RepID=UPI003784D082